MDLQWDDAGSEARFSAYVEMLSKCLGHRDRVAPFRSLYLAAHRRLEQIPIRLNRFATTSDRVTLL